MRPQKKGSVGAQYSYWVQNYYGGHFDVHVKGATHVILQVVCNTILA